MKRLITMLFALALFGAGSPALAQDDWDDDDGEIGADEFETDADDGDDFGDDAFGETSGTTTTTSDQGAPLGLAPAELGFGFRRTLSGALGPEIEYWLSDKLLVTGGLVIAYNSPPGDGDAPFVLGLSGGGFYNLLSGDRAALLAGGRLVVAVNTVAGIDTATGETESSLQFAVELPARTEVFLSKILSIHFETGLSVIFTGDNGPVPYGGSRAPFDSTVISVGATAGLFGAAGVTLYWP